MTGRERRRWAIAAGLVTVASFLYGFLLGADVDPEPDWREARRARPLP